MTANPCWCCGHECMFCPADEKHKECAYIFSVNGMHWCPLCKYTGCDWCCGCPGCQASKRGGWSPKGTQVNHDGTEIREKA